MGIKFKKIILLLGDILILYLSLYLTLIARYYNRPISDLWQSHLAPFTIIFAVWLVLFYISNLYNLNIAVNNFKYYRNLTKTLLISTLLSVAFFYLNPGLSIAPKRNLLIFIIIFTIIFLIWRNLFNYSIKSRLLKNNIAFIGCNELVEELVQFLIDKPHLGMSISFIIGETNKNFSDIPIYKDINELKNLILKRKINSIILTSDPSQSNELRSLLFECLSLGINFIGLSKFYEDITGKIPVRVINKMWFLENLNEGDKKIFDWFKRLYDILFALLIFFLTLPFWPLIAIAIKIESKGPVFIAMTRLGKNKKEFKMFKFRSMIEEGNMRTMTLFNDPRVTKFGSFMRKIRIDEIPQILNIIKGEMSFVGPRPERPELAEELEKQIPFFNERMLVKPGATGWDQISGEYHSPSYEDTLKKIQYDLFYIKNRSIYLDASIILKTIATVLSKKGI